MHTYQPRRESNDGELDLGDLGGLSQYQQQHQQRYPVPLPQQQQQPPLMAPAAAASPSLSDPQAQGLDLQQPQQPPDFSYNQLVLPPSYEDSVLYDPAPALPQQQGDCCRERAHNGISFLLACLLQSSPRIPGVSLHFCVFYPQSPSPLVLVFSNLSPSQPGAAPLTAYVCAQCPPTHAFKT